MERVIRRHVRTQEREQGAGKVKTAQTQNGGAASQSPALPTTAGTEQNVKQDDPVHKNPLQPASVRRMPTLELTSQTAAPALNTDSADTGAGVGSAPPAASESQSKPDAKRSNGAEKDASKTPADRSKALLAEAGADGAQSDSENLDAEKGDALEDKALSDKLAEHEHKGVAGKKGSVKKKGGASDTAPDAAGKKESAASDAATGKDAQSGKRGGSSAAAADSAANAVSGKRRASQLDQLQDGQMKTEEITRKRRAEVKDDKTPAPKTSKAKGPDKSENAESKSADRNEGAKAKLGNDGNKAAKVKGGTKEKEKVEACLPRGESRNRAVPERLSPGGQSVPSDANAAKQAAKDEVKKTVEKGKGSVKEKTGTKRGSGQASEERGNSSKKAKKNGPEVFNIDKILDKRVEKGK